MMRSPAVRESRFGALEETERVLSAPRDTIEKIQKEHLSTALPIAWNDMGFYRRLFERRGLEVPEEHPAFDQWPVWRVADLRAAMNEFPPFGDLYTSGGLNDIWFIHSSSGTTGVPRFFPECRMDIPDITEVYRRHLVFRGMRASDRCVITTTMGMTRGGWSKVRAIDSIGATIVPAGSGKITPSVRLARLIFDLDVTVLSGNGSYMGYLAQRALEQGLDPADSQVRLIGLSGESCPAETRRELASTWGATVIDGYSTTDAGWIASECAASAAVHGKLGMHVFEDTCRVEILDEEGKPVPPGESGEVVLTSWHRLSSPRIRFGTGDRASVTFEPCECGRTGARLMPIHGRVDDAVRYHGQTIWWTAVSDHLSKRAGRSPEFVLKVDRGSDGGGAASVVLVVDSDAVAQLGGEEALSDDLQKQFNVRMAVSGRPVAEVLALSQADRGAKAKRVIFESAAVGLRH